MYRVCLGPECGRLVEAPRNRCPDHQTAWSRQRGSSAQRGYGPAHQRLRTKMVGPLTRCSRCQQMATPGNPMELDHIIPQAKGGKTEAANMQPLCRRCNAGKGARIE